MEHLDFDQVEKTLLGAVLNESKLSASLDPNNTQLSYNSAFETKYKLEKN